MGVLSEIDGPAPCYPAFPQVVWLRGCHRDEVNRPAVTWPEYAVNRSHSTLASSLSEESKLNRSVLVVRSPGCYGPARLDQRARGGDHGPSQPPDVPPAAQRADHAPARSPRSATQHPRVLGRPSWFIPSHLTYSKALARWGYSTSSSQGTVPGSLRTSSPTHVLPGFATQPSSVKAAQRRTAR